MGNAALRSHTKKTTRTATPAATPAATTGACQVASEESDEPEGQEKEAGSAQRHAANVEGARYGFAGFRNREPGHDQGHHRDRDVDPKINHHGNT